MSRSEAAIPANTKIKYTKGTQFVHMRAEKNRSIGDNRLKKDDLTGRSSGRQNNVGRNLVDLSSKTFASPLLISQDSDDCTPSSMEWMTHRPAAGLCCARRAIGPQETADPSIDFQNGREIVKDAGQHSHAFVGKRYPIGQILIVRYADVARSH